MQCRKCGSHDVMISVVQGKMTTKTKKPGFARTLVRWTMIALTLGAWSATQKKGAKTTGRVDMQKVAVCQNCGASWNA
jgi:hypothetical protein